MNKSTIQRQAGMALLMRVLTAAALVTGGAVGAAGLAHATTDSSTDPASSQLAVDAPVCPHFACGQNHNQVLL